MPIDTKETIRSQPQATTPMAAGGNRNALDREVGVDGQRDWSFGLFDCTSACGLCCWATWCPCVVYSKTNSASVISRVTALLSLEGAKDIIAIVTFMAACTSPAMLGSCRLVTARKSAHATAFVGAPLEIALRLVFAILVRSHRSAAKSS